MSRLPLGYSVRLAVIKKVEPTFVVCEFFDRIGEKPVKCPRPQPYPGRGGGVLVGPERDTLVLLSNGPGQKWYIVAFVPDINFYSNLSGQADIRYDETEYPNLEEGEVVLKANSGQTVKLLKSGNLALDAGIGDKSADIELSQSSNALFFRVNNIYSFTEAGRTIEGIVKRDVGEEDDSITMPASDLLTGETYDYFLSDIGRSPTEEVQMYSTNLAKRGVRNPALVEKRDIVYEYAHSFDVLDLEREINATRLSDGTFVYSDPMSRDNRRTDVLNTNLKNFNHLIERVQGTLVDIYGNVLDINRRTIPVPPASSMDAMKDTAGQVALKNIYNYLRRSIKYHFEINSRKDINSAEPNYSSLLSGNAKNHSRWSLDVDAEGLTKINIPSSSETGNIPVMGRYVVAKDSNGNPIFDKSAGNIEKIDAKLSQFGAKDDVNRDNFAGQKIKSDEYKPKLFDHKIYGNNDSKIPAAVTVGTAHHDMFNIASSIFNGTGGKLKSPDIKEPSVVVKPLSEEIDNTIGSATANAGGRSVHANLDGSLEMSIGADTVDRKSVMLDLAGALVSRIGRDKNGRSIIQQTDGDIIIQVGGHGVDDERFNSDGFEKQRPGRIEIHLVRPGLKGEKPQRVIIDEDGITFDIQGNGVISTTGDLVLSAGGKLLLNGEIINKFGSFDMDKRTAGDSAEIKERRKGRSN